MKEVNSAKDVPDIIHKFVYERLSSRNFNYFVPDSASVNKAAVQLFINNTGDHYWFPCVIHFCELAMRDAVEPFLSSAPILILPPKF